MAAPPFGESVLGMINYVKRPDVQRQKTMNQFEKGLDQGGEFMGNSARANKDGLKHLDICEMRIHDARPVRDVLSIDTHGFQIAELRTALPETLEVLYEEGERQIRSIYWPELCELVRRSVEVDGRRPKYVFCIGTQKFTEDKSRGLLGSYSRSAHADFSEAVFDGAHKMLTKRGVSEEEALAMDLVFLNAWRPYGETVRDNPLCILDWTTVDPERDVHGLHRGAATKKGHIYGTTVSHNPAHRWVYLPRMEPTEVWLFKQADSRTRPGLSKHAFHTSFREPGHGPADRSRRSIAVRLICAFEPRQPKAAL